MAFEHYIYCGTKRLRCGYTTGSCAALAAKAATQMLLTGQDTALAAIITPVGLRVEAEVLDAYNTKKISRCAIRKDAGDDADVTDGALIYAEVSRLTTPGVQIRGGPGVGRVVKAGLEQAPGEAAINSTPRKMIRQEVEAVCAEQGYSGGILVTVSVPEGKTLAARTFNPNLGVEGGISILGTTGIVEPKSLAALLDSIELEIHQRALEDPSRLILTPGNYGQDFSKAHPGMKKIPAVACANFIGDALDMAARNGIARVLLVGHIGKLVKLAGGIMNTHSRTADCRTELFCAHAAANGAGCETARELLDAPTSDACIDILKKARLQAPVLASLAGAVQLHLQRRAAGAFAVGAVAFSHKHGILFETEGAAALMKEMEAKR